MKVLSMSCAHMIIIVIIYVKIVIILAQVTLQPSTPIANQLPGQLVSTEIKTI